MVSIITIDCDIIMNNIMNKLLSPEITLTIVYIKSNY